MTFRLAPHSVLRITVKIFKAFKDFFLRYFRWGRPTIDDFLIYNSQTFGLLHHWNLTLVQKKLYIEMEISFLADMHIGFVFENLKPLSLANCWGIFR